MAVDQYNYALGKKQCSNQLNDEHRYDYYMHSVNSDDKSYNTVASNFTELHNLLGPPKETSNMHS